MTSNRGYILIIVLLLGSILSLHLFYITQLLTQFQTQFKLAFNGVKTEYLARSGITVAPTIWQDIPLLSFSYSNVTFKSQLYQYAHTGYPITRLEGDVYLLKDSFFLYSIALIPPDYRIILITPYTYQNNQLSLGITKRFS